MIIIFNPVAGRRRTQRLWQVLDVMMANGIRVDLVETAWAGHAEVLARDACSNGKRMVVAAGGDGTIAEVANGLMGTDTRLGVIPLGTANVLANELELPFAPHAVAAALAFGRTRPLWPGIVRGGDASRLFVQMLGVGFDAHVVHRLWLPLKRAAGKGAYVLQTLREIPRYDFGRICLNIDGMEADAGSVIISKGRLYAGKYLLAPAARPSEAGFSVVLFERSSRSAAMMYGAALPLGLLHRAPGVRHIRASRIEFLGNQMSPAQADGDPVGCTPLNISDAPGPIQIVVG